MWIFKFLKKLFRRKKPVVIRPVKSDLELQKYLIDLYNTMEIQTLPGQTTSHITWYVDKCTMGKKKYETVAEKVGCPWEIVAVIHGLESSFSWWTNLMNGQPYTQKTTWVPKGYGPWKSWEDAAVDAFMLKKRERKLPTKWDLGNSLEFLLRYNGMGYYRKGFVSPYLWSYSNHYVKQNGGKYVKDGVFVRDAISMQVGAAVMLKKLSFLE
jgi:lysozyme family protein